MRIEKLRSTIHISKNNLLGRSVGGVARELRLHYKAYYLDFLNIWEEPLKSTDIGSVVIGTGNYDDNAIGSECIWKIPQVAFDILFGNGED